jgi:hypothetical protein
MKALLPLLAVAAGLLVSCASQTTADRIAENPAKFHRLSSKQQELVQRGELARGMSEDAVFLAWGKPSRVFEGSQGGVATARWDYASLQPVYGGGFYGGFGYGYRGPYPGPYRGYRGPYGYYPYYGVAPRVDYVPYRKATVWLKAGKVESWERSR